MKPMNPSKPKRGIIPAGFADGGRVEKDELDEAKALRSGRVTPGQYADGEMAEGESGSRGQMVARGKAMASGKLTPAQYAKSEMQAEAGECRPAGYASSLNGKNMKK